MVKFSEKAKGPPSHYSSNQSNRKIEPCLTNKKLQTYVHTLLKAGSFSGKLRKKEKDKQPGLSDEFME